MNVFLKNESIQNQPDRNFESDGINWMIEKAHSMLHADRSMPSRIKIITLLKFIVIVSLYFVICDGARGYLRGEEEWGILIR